MRQFKNLCPFIAAIGVFFLASNSPMWKQMNQKQSVENEVKPILVKEFK
jgi:preprotein translocase subunit YajC